MEQIPYAYNMYEAITGHDDILNDCVKFIIRQKVTTMDRHDWIRGVLLNEGFWSLLSWDYNCGECDLIVTKPLAISGYNITYLSSIDMPNLQEIKRIFEYSSSKRSGRSPKMYMVNDDFMLKCLEEQKQIITLRNI